MGFEYSDTDLRTFSHDDLIYTVILKKQLAVKPRASSEKGLGKEVVCASNSGALYCLASCCLSVCRGVG